MQITEFQKKTFQKVKENVLSFIPDGDGECTTIDIFKIISNEVSKLNDREINALLTIGNDDEKRTVIVQRFYDLFINKYFKEGEDNES